MNFYKLYIGDYQRDTGTLTLAEHGAYGRLLDHCYATEEPLPLDLDACCRIARAMTKAERNAVKSVVRRFFAATDEGYVQHRVQREIRNQKYADARIADLRARESYRKFRDVVLLRCGDRCFYCGASDVPLQLDHVIPRSRGGADTEDNLVPACRHCNASKGARTPQEWECAK